MFFFINVLNILCSLCNTNFLPINFDYFQISLKEFYDV